MAITTVDGIIAGAQQPVDFLKIGATMEAAGVFHTFFYVAGTPGAAVANGLGLSGAALTSYAGQLPFTNPVSGNTYLSRLTCTGTVAGRLVLIDRLWHNDTIVEATTTGVTINSATFPARDRNGSTDGEGVMVAIEVSAATTNAGAITNTTLTYTNSTATGGTKTATIASFPATAVAGTFVPFRLAAGDTGVRSLGTLTLGTSYGGGTIHLVAYRVIAELPCLLANVGASIDAITGGFPRLYDNSVLQLLWMPTATTATTIAGTVSWTQG